MVVEVRGVGLGGGGPGAAGVAAAAGHRAGDQQGAPAGAALDVDMQEAATSPPPHQGPVRNNRVTAAALRAGLAQPQGSPGAGGGGAAPLRPPLPLTVRGAPHSMEALLQAHAQWRENRQQHQQQPQQPQSQAPRQPPPPPTPQQPVQEQPARLQPQQQQQQLQAHQAQPAPSQPQPLPCPQRPTGVAAPQAVSAPAVGVGTSQAGEDSEGDYGAVVLSGDSCCAIGADLVASQNRAVEVQGHELAAAGGAPFGRRLLQHLRGLGAGTSGLSVCLVPAGRTAILHQLHDDLPNWARLLSRGRADAPLPDDMVGPLHEMAVQVQQAYMHWAGQQRTLRPPRQAHRAPGTAPGGPSRGGRPSRSTADSMSMDSVPTSTGGASARTAAMSISSGGGTNPAPTSRGTGRSNRKKHSRRGRGAAVAGGSQ